MRKKVGREWVDCGGMRPHQKHASHGVALAGAKYGEMSRTPDLHGLVKNLEKEIAKAPEPTLKPSGYVWKSWRRRSSSSR